MRNDEIESELDFVASIPHININAFCLSEDTARVFQEVASDRRLSRVNFAIHMGDINAAIEFYQSGVTPALIFLEFETDRDELMEALSRMADVCDESTKVVLIGQVNDVFFYRSLMKQGINEYIVSPINPRQTVHVIASLYSDIDRSLGRVVSFLGSKGGVGSSTIAHNSGWVLSKKFSKNIIISDLDLFFGTVGLNFNQEVVQGVPDAVYSPERQDAMFLDRLLIKHDSDIGLFATPARLSNNPDLSEDSYEKILDLLRKSVSFVILDLPHLWSSWIKSVFLQSDDIVLVIEPELASLRNGKDLIEMLRKLRPNDPLPHVVFNKVDMPKRPEISVDELSDALGLEPITSIEFDPYSFGTATNDGQMISELTGQVKSKEDFIRISRVLTGRLEIKEKKHNILSLLREKILNKK
ncbi:MAG: AAA family ATPase [Alphaproteobacteria bacterium]|nr:AAA family ATPase [Alphaproteobacteria bacterium]